MFKPVYEMMKSLQNKQDFQENQHRKSITQLEHENISLKLALAESEEIRLTDSLETKLAIAELAEVVIDG